MKKSPLLITILILLYAVALGQTDDPGCYLNVKNSDITCNDQTSCSPNEECGTTTFTVTCPGKYYIKAWTACTGTHCAHCESCVIVQPSGGGLAFPCATNTECSSLGCCKVCTYTLSAGSYTLYVCKYPCNESDEEACCSDQYDCTAWGQISDSVLTCP